MHTTVERLRDAINAHSPSAMTELLAPEYVSEQPAHPNRGFSGRDQVDKNWSLLFTGVPDLKVEVSAAVDDGTTSFSEWEFLGHYGDGSVFHERGIMLLRLRDDLIASARMYFEEVEEDGADIDETMRQSARVDAASEPGS